MDQRVSGVLARLIVASGDRETVYECITRRQCLVPFFPLFPVLAQGPRSYREMVQ